MDATENFSYQSAFTAAVKDEIGQPGGALHVQQRIAELGTARGKDWKFDRRKLTDIANGKDVKISFTELTALDAYLTQRGKGLATLMQAPNLLKPLASSGIVAFLLGAKPIDEQANTVMSRWDVLALADLQRSIDRLNASVHFTIDDVLLNESIAPSIKPEEMFREDRWYHLLDDKEERGVVILASPKASHAAELALSRMCEIDPFRPEDVSKNLDRVKFHFLWGAETGLPSSFAKPAPENIRSTATTVGDRYVGIEFNGKIHSRDRGEHGLLVVQRRSTGQIWMVIAGVTGPATYATARLLPTLAASIPESQPGKDSPVLACLIEAQVAVRKDLLGDKRQVIDQRLIDVVTC